MRLVVALDIADSPACFHQVGNASPGRSGTDLNARSGCGSPQSVRKNFSRDPSRLTMLNNAPITFVQVSATFQLPSTASSNNRKVPSLFELYYNGARGALLGNSLA